MTTQEPTQAQTPVVLDPEGGDARWFNNDLLTIKATGAQTGGAFLAVEELAPRGKMTPLHLHPAEEETFYVVEGELVIHIAGDERTLGPGAFASVPRGVAHAYRVASEVARTLIVITPGDGAMEEFFKIAGEPATRPGLPPLGPLDLERIGAAAQRTGAVELLGPPPFAPAG